MFDMDGFFLMAQTYYFIAFSMHIYYNFQDTESEEKIILDFMLTYIPFKNFNLLHSRVGAGAASKISPGAA
jgi:hypothetical protein